MSKGANIDRAKEAAIGSVIRKARKRVGMSQDVLARSAGVTFQQIQKYEHGTNRVSLTRFCQIATAVGEKPGTLFAKVVKEAGL